ncbi:hypothetical protein MASR2M78_23200 [Treponema sp.]
MNLKKRAMLLSLVAAVGLISTIVAQVLSNKVREELQDANENQYLSYILADEFRQSSEDLTSLCRSYVATGDKTFFTQYWNIVKWRAGDIPRPVNINEKLYPGKTKKQTDIMMELGFTTKELALLDEANANSNTLIATESQAMNSITDNTFASGPAKPLDGESPKEFALRIVFDVAYFSEVSKTLSPVNTFSRELEERTVSSVRAKSTQLRAWTRVSVFAQVITGIILLLILLAYFQMIRAIKRTSLVLKDISEGEGDLTKRLVIKKQDEIGELANYFNLSLEKIKNLVVLIKSKSKNLSDIGIELSTNMSESAASINQISSNLESMRNQTVNQSASVSETNSTMQQITHNIGKLNQHIDQQSASVSESSAAIEQMLSNIASVTQNLVKNADNVEALSAASEKGHESLAIVSQKIHEIAKDSEGLIQISAVIGNIASQTNLLSMNAAIEAAHAGDAGRGFAVVADEIRKLAESSASQAKTVSTVLKTIKSSVDLVLTSTQTVMKQFEDIDSKIKTVSEFESTIRNSMDEQSAGSKEILMAIAELTTITSEVKSGSDEMLIGSQEVIQESKNLEIITSEVSGGMSEIASGVQQITIAVNQINDLSNDNKESIQALNREVEKFKV